MVLLTRHSSSYINTNAHRYTRRQPAIPTFLNHTKIGYRSPVLDTGFARERPSQNICKKITKRRWTTLLLAFSLRRSHGMERHLHHPVHYSAMYRSVQKVEEVDPEGYCASPYEPWSLPHRQFRSRCHCGGSTVWTPTRFDRPGQ